MSGFKQYSEKTRDDFHTIYLDRRAELEKLVKAEQAKKADNHALIKAYQKRILILDLSIRLVYNTNWLSEQKVFHLDRLAGQLNSPTADKEAKEVAAINIHRIRKMNNCKKCFERGFTAINISMGELSICNCAEKTLDIFLVQDV